MSNTTKSDNQKILYHFLSALLRPGALPTWRVVLTNTTEDSDKWWSVNENGVVKFGRTNTAGSTAKRALTPHESSKKIGEKLRKGYVPFSITVDRIDILQYPVLRDLVRSGRVFISPQQERGIWTDQAKIATLGDNFPWVSLKDADGKPLMSCSLYDFGSSFDLSAP
jgi:hypothetical protein